MEGVNAFNFNFLWPSFRLDCLYFFFLKDSFTFMLVFITLSHFPKRSHWECFDCEALFCLFCVGLVRLLVDFCCCCCWLWVFVNIPVSPLHVSFRGGPTGWHGDLSWQYTHQCSAFLLHRYLLGCPFPTPLYSFLSQPQTHTRTIAGWYGDLWMFLAVHLPMPSLPSAQLLGGTSHPLPIHWC